MRHPYDGHVRHGRVRAQDVLQLRGGDLKALHLDLGEEHDIGDSLHWMFKISSTKNSFSCLNYFEKTTYKGSFLLQYLPNHHRWAKLRQKK